LPASETPPQIREPIDLAICRYDKWLGCLTQTPSGLVDAEISAVVNSVCWRTAWIPVDTLLHLSKTATLAAEAARPGEPLEAEIETRSKILALSVLPARLTCVPETQRDYGSESRWLYHHNQPTTRPIVTRSCTRLDASYLPGVSLG
jgi:hypothetical protein